MNNYCDIESKTKTKTKTKTFDEPSATKTKNENEDTGLSLSLSQKPAPCQPQDTLTTFTSDEFGQIRLVQGEDGEPRFCLADICKPLGLSVKGVKQRLGEGVISNYPLQTAGGKQLMTFVNEEGLYDTILESRKPEARRFRHWVTGEVLPSIRKHGAYMTDVTIERLLTSPELVIGLATQLREERKARVAAEGRASYTERVLSCPDLVDITQIAQDYGMTAIRMNLLLHEIGVQFKDNEQWILYAKYKDKGYVQSRTFVLSDGRCKMHTRWTQRGRLFLYEVLKDKGVLPVMECAGGTVKSEK